MTLPVFCPTSPPAPMPANIPPLTVPLSTETLLIVPPFCPATTPTIRVLPRAEMATLSRFRLRTVPALPMNGNSPIGD